MFLVDLIVNFRFSFLDEAGNEVIEPKEISLHYLKHRFFIDLIALVPFDYIGSGNKNIGFIKAFKLVKVIGIFRLDEIINYLNLPKRTK